LRLVSNPAPFTVDVAEDAGRVRITARGELDLATAGQLEEALLPQVRQGRHAVLDLRELDFMDSSGVRVVVTAHTAAVEHEGRLTLVRGGARSPVGRVLEVSGLEGMLEIVDEG
jgi:anti-anti-sigma factor